MARRPKWRTIARTCACSIGTLCCLTAAIGAQLPAGCRVDESQPPEVNRFAEAARNVADKEEREGVRVLVSAFVTSRATARLEGRVVNRSQSAQSHTLRVDFLDASGTVRASEEAKVDAVAPNGSRPFVIVVRVEGVAAFRYRKLE